MKSIFDKKTRDEVINRITSLTANSQPLWGKMTVTQMVRHCSLCEEYYYGTIKVNRSFLGRIFGKVAISGILKDENSSFKKNAPTSPSFKVTEEINNLEVEKDKWKVLIERYGTFGNENFNHWFFGKMTKSQLGQFIYKHCDHHLKQFGI
jgi:hypothetical protein